MQGFPPMTIGSNVILSSGGALLRFPARRGFPLMVAVLPAAS
jgi:hypothetical protein